VAAEGFRLEQVLRVARSKEEQAQQHLAQLAAERELAQAQLRALREQEWQQLTALRDDRGQVGSLDPAEHDQARAYLEQLASWIVERAGQVAAVEDQVSASRGELLELLRERRSLERLKERQLAEQAREGERREQRQADDATSNRFARRGREAS